MSRRARWALIGLVVFVVAGTLPAWRVTAKANLRDCQAEALRNFAHLRKANEQGVHWPPHQFENDYITYCMSAKGFTLREESSAGRIISGERALHIMNPESWSWDFYRVVPKP